MAMVTHRALILDAIDHHIKLPGDRQPVDCDMLHGCSTMWRTWTSAKVSMIEDKVDLGPVHLEYCDKAYKDSRGQIERRTEKPQDLRNSGHVPQLLFRTNAPLLP